MINMRAILVSILTLISYAYQFNEFEDRKRNLLAWSSHNTCQNCNDDINWNFLNNAWDNYDIISLQSEDYDQASEYGYWHNAVSSDIIYISDHNYDLNLHAYYNATVSSHPLCEWKISLKEEAITIINITSTSENYEDFFMYSITDKEDTYYYSKYFTNWNSNSVQLNLAKTMYVKIKAKKLSNNSNYLINITQDVSKPADFTVVILIFGAIAILWTLEFLAIISFIAWRMLKGPNNTRVHIEPNPKQLERIALIK